MPLANILKSLGFRGAAGARTAKPAARRLAVEALEDRWVPATLTVGGGKTYATIQAALAAAGNGDTVAVYPGTYTVGSTADPGGLKITQSNLKLQARGSNVKIVADAGLANDAIIDVTGTNDKIDGFTIDGNGNQSKSIDAAVEIFGGGSATVSNNTIRGLFNASITGPSVDRVGMGVRVGDNTRATGKVGTATVLDNEIESYNKAGVTIDAAGSFATVTGNTITGVGAGKATTQQYGVAVINGAGARITDNEIDKNAFNGDTRAAGVLVSNTSAKVVIAENGFTGDQDGVILSHTSNALVRDNDIIGGAADGILLLDSNNNTIRDNDLDRNGNDRPAGSGPGGGIALFDSSYNKIWYNDVEGSNQDALYIDGSNDGTNFTTSDSVGNDVRGNKFEGATDGNGVYLYYAADTKLTDNTIRHNSMNGILVQGGGGNTISSSKIVGNGLDGVRFQRTDNNHLTHSTIASNGRYGVAVVNSTDTTIDYNTIAKNTSSAIFIDSRSTGTQTAHNSTGDGHGDHDDHDDHDSGKDDR
jgi:parallel beta-helix repeat protein